MLFVAQASDLYINTIPLESQFSFETFGVSIQCCGLMIILALELWI